MNFGYYNRKAPGVPRRFDENAYLRQNLAAWDRKWHGLSVEARYSFLNQVKIPAKEPAPAAAVPDVAIDRFQSHVLQELTAAGFVTVQPARFRAFTDRVVACDGLYDFAMRARTLLRYHLLAASQPSNFAEYIDHAYYRSQLAEVLSGVLRTVGINLFFQIDHHLDRYVMKPEWPEWVARSLHEPLADRVLDVVKKAEGPIPLAELPGRIAGSHPDQVRAVVDKLVARLALVEDMQSDTWELMVGFLPSVAAALGLAAKPRERPPLLTCERPEESGPDEAIIASDIRAALFEIASEPPRLRRDQTLFHSEAERFQAALGPLAKWLLDAMKWSAEGRLNRALAWARALQLAKVEPDGKHVRLHLTPKGQTWLFSGEAERHAAIFGFVRTFESHGELYSPHLGLFLAGLNPFDSAGPCDMHFLGMLVTAVKVEHGKGSQYYWHATDEDLLALRKHLDLALAVLKPGVFYRLDSVESHLVFGDHNPLNRGLPPERIAVFWMNRPVPGGRAQREEVGRLMINAFVLERLVPFGCVQAAIDDEGRICIARNPRYDAYFGREVARPDPAPITDVTARVVVQPDFSVVVIGPNPAPAAALVPFCERATRGGGQGAVVMKLSRESVVKAVRNGLNPAEIVARLERHASNDVPANVLRQVKEWSTWVRRVTTSSLIALRCPDSDTADRVMAALKRQAERVNSTLVAIDRKKLTAVERNKLQDQGILVDEERANRDTRSKSRQK